uniref:Uncharacterized protein n=1 Tax=Brassica oleracea var. oleracea TaxID=109376 RepID=A0A0D3DRL5_BRAOL
MSWSLLIFVLREKANQSRLPIEMEKIDDTEKANDWSLRFFLCNGLMIYSYLSLENLKGFHHIGASACLSDSAPRRRTSAECFSVNGLYHKAMIMQTNTLDDFSNTSGTEDFQQQNQLANSSIIQCDRQMGESRTNVIVLATSEKLLSVSIFYIANAAFVLARLR